MNSELIRKDFPILETKVNGHPVVYFDNGATTQRPLPVMRAVMDYVTRNNGNPHRGAHIFAMSASEAYDTSKTVVKDFIGAKSEKEIIYTRNHSQVPARPPFYGEHSAHRQEQPPPHVYVPDGSKPLRR